MLILAEAAADFSEKASSQHIGLVKKQISEAMADKYRKSQICKTSRKQVCKCLSFDRREYH